MRSTTVQRVTQWRTFYVAMCQNSVCWMAAHHFKSCHSVITTSSNFVFPRSTRQEETWATRNLPHSHSELVVWSGVGVMMHFRPVSPPLNPASESCRVTFESSRYGRPKRPQHLMESKMTRIHLCRNKSGTKRGIAAIFSDNGAILPLSDLKNKHEVYFWNFTFNVQVTFKK